MSGKPELLKKMNLNLIYKALIELKTATRQELSDSTQISLTTIRTLLDELLEKEQIIEMQLDESSGGRRALRYGLNAFKNLILSFFARKNNLTYQVISLTGQIIDSGKKEGMKDAWQNLAREITFECCQKWDIIAVGVGAMGMVKNGAIFTGCDLDGFTVNNIGNEIKDTYKIPVIVENDLNAVAYGYATSELAKKNDSECENSNIAYIEFSEKSVSAGFITNGTILRGNNQFSGELSFMPLEKGKTLNDLITSATDNETVTDLVSRVLAVVNCVINPTEIIISGKLLLKHNVLINQINTSLNNYLTDSICPKIVFASNFEQDYMLGITRLVQHDILGQLPVAKMMSSECKE